MNREDQKDFVKSLCDSIKIEILSKIESGRIPENWDGVELRQLLANKFVSETVGGAWGDKRNTRRKEFESYYVVNNL